MQRPQRPVLLRRGFPESRGLAGNHCSQIPPGNEMQMLKMGLGTNSSVPRN